MVFNLFNKSKKEEKKEYLVINKTEDNKKIQVIIPKYNIDKIRIITEDEYDEGIGKWGEHRKTQIMLKSGEPYLVKSENTMKFVSENDIVKILENYYNY